MPDGSTQRSPLAMVVLALLAEAPMHAYRMHELIKERGKDTVVNVAQRNSVYQAIARLRRAGLIRVQETSRDEGRPERVVYHITEDGTAALRAWVTDMLAVPAREFPLFPAALSFLVLLPPREAQRQLEARLAALEHQLGASEAVTTAALSSGLPRLFLVEDEYRHAMMRAELVFLRDLIQDLRSKKLTWSKEWVRKVAAAMAAAGPR